MQEAAGSFGRALMLVLTLDTELVQIIFLSVGVSGTAVLVAAVAGIPVGALLGLRSFPGRRVIAALLYTFMGLPPVVVGLAAYLVFSRSGPLGPLELLFTPVVMVIAQTVLALPIVAGLTMMAVRAKDADVRETALSLGATEWQATATVIREARGPIIGAVVTAFGRVTAEVGAVMIVGGNIAGHTRVMTTAIVLETSRGNFEMALGLGLVLLALSFAVNSILYNWQEGVQ